MEQNFLSNQEPADSVARASEPVQEAPEPVQEAPEPVQEAPEPVQEAPEPVQNGLLDYIIENALLNARFKTDFEVKSYEDALGKMFANTECYNSSFKGCKSFTANPTTYKLFVINNMLNVAMNRIRWNNIKPILTAYQYKHIVNAYKKTIFNVDWYNEMFRNSKDDPTVCEQLENETKNFISTFSNYLEKGIFSNKYKKNAAKQVKFLLNCMNLDEEEKKEIYYFRYLSESQILSSVSWDIHRASWMGSDEVEEKVDTIRKTLSYMQDELVDEDFEKAKEKMKKVSRFIYKYRKALQSPTKTRENYRQVNEFIQEFYNEFNDEVKKAQAKDEIKNEKEQYWSRVINYYYVIPISKYRAEYKKKEVAMYGYDDKANVFFKIKDLRKFCNQPYRENGLILKEIKPFRGIGNIKKEDEIIYIDLKTTGEEKVGKVTDFFPNYTKNVKSVEQPDLKIEPTIPDQVHTPRLAAQPAHNLEIVPTIPDQVHTPRLAAQQAHNLEIEMVALNAPVPAAPEPVQELNWNQQN